jgi:hypothetical protein
MRPHRVLAFLILTAAGLCIPAWGQGSAVTPLNTVNIGVSLPGNQSLNATDNPVTVPLPTGTNTGLFHVGNVIKIDSEYLSITVVNASSLTASRAQLGSTSASHSANTAILRVYQLDVFLASPNTAIGAYQMNVNYDSPRLSLASVNVFPADVSPGITPLGTPVAVNTNTPGLLVLNSFNASASFQGAATSVARLYFTGTTPGPANISVNLTNIAGAAGNDLDPVANNVAGTLSASSVTVVVLSSSKRIRGQITSQ